LPLVLAGCATEERAPVAERPWHHVAGGLRNPLGGYAADDIWVMRIGETRAI
jgi:hypothetical protein